MPIQISIPFDCKVKGGESWVLGCRALRGFPSNSPAGDGCVPHTPSKRDKEQYAGIWVKTGGVEMWRFSREKVRWLDGGLGLQVNLRAGDELDQAVVRVGDLG